MRGMNCEDDEHRYEGSYSVRRHVSKSMRRFIQSWSRNSISLASGAVRPRKTQNPSSAPRSVVEGAFCYRGGRKIAVSRNELFLRNVTEC